MLTDEVKDIVWNSRTRNKQVKIVIDWFKENVDPTIKICTSCKYEVSYLYKKIKNMYEGS